MAGAAIVSLTACNDYLDVDAPSKQDNNSVFTKKSEINTALNGVYAQLLSGNLYGNALINTFVMNSDVEFKTYSNELSTDNSYRRFDCTSQGSDIKKTWDDAYKGIEYANNFIYQLEHSPLYQEGDSDLVQQMGEAKVMRAMLYHDIMWLFGDVPFSFEPTSVTKGTVLPIVSRDTINARLIADLEAIAPKMKFAANLTDGVERVSKEFCWSMIARIALTAGGYSLRPDLNAPNNHGTMARPDNYKQLYETAMNYCDSVIKSGTHHLGKTYQQVFVDECNYKVANGDDPIFEIPFAYNSTSSVGYIHGPKSELNSGTTSGKNIWGEASSSAALNAFYRFLFDEKDLRRDYVIGLWGYLYDGTPNINRGYTTYNNKWSKLWANVNTNPQSSGNTGINFPYMRYADVLLMYAEAANEVKGGPTAEAKAAVKQVRARAFGGNDAEKVEAYVDAAASKEDFLKVVLDERRLEFAGENMRWKDLVRNNKYAEELYWTFLRYIGAAQNAGTGTTYLEAVEQHDGLTPGRYENDMPYSLFYRIADNPVDPSKYTNTTLDVLELYNPYHGQYYDEGEKKWKAIQIPADDANTPTNRRWQNGDFYNWWNADAATPKNECLYSLYGFIRGAAQSDQFFLVNNDGTTIPMPEPNELNVNALPVVRYILPYPNAVIQRSAGQYKNYYGYNN